MFKKSRRKIVAAIMSILVLLFLGTLVIIYSSSYFEVSATNYEMLKRYAELYFLEEQPLIPHGNNEPPEMPEPAMDVPMDEPDGPHFEDTPAFHLSTFYSVAISENGEILVSDTDDDSLYDEANLETYACEILENGRKKGAKGSLIYIVQEKNGYTLVAFMDNTIMQDSMTTLFRYTLVFGSVAIAAFFFIAVYLARRIVNPLEESYQKQKQFISDAGHELKTPVSVVSANAELLSMQIGENQWLANIQYENERMGKLVSQLLELARTEHIALQTERLNLSRLVSGEALPFECVAFEKGLTLDCDITDDIFTDGNSGQLRQLVSILLDNAICHCTSGREIKLALKAERSNIRLSVINDSDEIPAEQRKQIFERFYRVDAARNSEDKHYGLGLAIAKGIVTAHKGKINVSCYDGKVEFAVQIPLQKN